MEIEGVKENKSKRFTYTIWIEKYRPDSISHMILPTSMRKLFNKFLKDKEVPSLLLYSSSPGVGKTTIAKAICEDIGADYLYINTSLENGIDVLRSRIEKFATSMSLNGGKKIIILDEFDGATRQLQDALRASIEGFHDTCRFILTCNYISKIIKPIKSRCQLIDFNFMDKEIQEEIKPKIIKRLVDICKNEKIEYLEETIIKMVNDFYPDMRKMIGILQKFYKQNGVINNDIFAYANVSTELIDLILNKKFTKARTFIIESSYNYEELYRFMYDELIPKLPKDKQAQGILIIADYMKWHSNGIIDPEIHFSAFMLELIAIL